MVHWLGVIQDDTATNLLKQNAHGCWAVYGVAFVRELAGRKIATEDGKIA